MRTIAIAIGIVTLLVPSAFGIVAPRKGGQLPDAYYQRKAEDRNAFLLNRAWVNKMRAIKMKREAFLKESGIQSSVYMSEEYSVSGDFYFPVLLGAFSNRPATYASDSLQKELFDGPWPPGTMTDYYDEVSYGLLNVSGTVSDWVSVSQVDVYYEGLENGLGADAHTGQFLLEVLNANDPFIDFSIYDNDGPDGVPNSGDDDGYVDFIAFVHSESGGECGNTNIWSHSWVYQGWPESGSNPYTTNDPASGGGFIKVNDYTIQPGRSCSGSMAEIGVFCHETGHAFGLPDLYDANKGGPEGIGHWGIMGSGNWNIPSQPSHPCVWTRKELGWIVPTEVDWQGGVVSIPQIATNPVAYKLPFTDNHFRRISECAITGSYSLRCGVTDGEGIIKGWLGDGGYGNLWNESIERDFAYSGTDTVTFTYDFQYELETNYDYAYTIVRVNSSETVLETYNGLFGSGTETLYLYPFLFSGYPQPVDYQLIFKVVSDWGWSDEDGKDPTNCGAFIVDNVSVTGGGENYSTDFEIYVDGWHQSQAANPSTEYWLVENRQAVGFDANLHGTGLLVFHIDEEVMHSLNGNCGSPCSDETTYDDAVRGVVLEEADGLNNLFNGDCPSPPCRGDGGDPYPGSSNNTTFNSASNPSSYDNTDRPTMIAITGISGSGNPMSAGLKAGDPPPGLVGTDPDTVDNNIEAADITVDGDLIRYGATMRLTKSGEMDIQASSIDWVDPIRVYGSFRVYGRVGGNWDLVLTNPDGQEAVLPNALYLNQIVAARLQSASVSLTDEGIEIRFELAELSQDEAIVLRRSHFPAGPWVELPGPVEEIGTNSYTYLDRSVEPGRTYYYKLDVKAADGSVTELYRGSAVVPSGQLVLAQNYPNPFNPSTTIYFYLPEESDIRLEIFDINGRLVRTVRTGAFHGGPHWCAWDGRNKQGDRVGSGVYIYRLTAGKHKISRKMVMIR